MAATAAPRQQPPPAAGSVLTEMKGFPVPSILNANSNDEPIDNRLSVLENDAQQCQDGRLNNTSNLRVTKQDEETIFNTVLNNENSSLNVDVLDSGEDDEDVIEMPGQIKDSGSHKIYDGGVSSFLLKPFFNPKQNPPKPYNVYKENPILKALFGTRENRKYSQLWVQRTIGSSPLPEHFKKPDLPPDDASPEQLKRPRRARRSVGKPNPTRSSPLSSNRSSVLKEIQLASHSKSEPVTPHSEKSSPEHPTVKIKIRSETQSAPNAFKRKISTSTMKPKLVANVNSERLVQLKKMVDSAIREHKVYSMTGGYRSVRNALKERGWIEKIDSDFKGRRRPPKFDDLDEAAFQYIAQNPSLTAMKAYNTMYRSNSHIHYSGHGEAEIINRMLRNVTEDLCWLSRPYPYYCWKEIGKFDMVNRLPKAYFSNKVGLCNTLQNMQWYFETGVASTQYPRTYNISLKEEYEAFKEDFRITSCICVLKWLTQGYKNGGEMAVRSTEGKVDMNVIEFALRRCAEFVKHKDHEDIDVVEPPTIWEHQWDHFLTQYYKLIHDGHLLYLRKEDHSTKAVVSNAQTMLNLVRPYWPQMDIEGTHNFWIVKPGARCCGNGIVIKNHLDHILHIVNPTITRETRYVVQKYIERPFLIYNTKFDIRQWFLVTSVYPLTIWMYKESYLRFCSHPFSLKHMHESIHLTNNAVQRRYKNPRRDRSLPDENMWDCYTFQTYLKAIGHPDAWDKIIYPGMKEGFVGALLASQETMERRKNCFELYGADFMISEKLSDGPWLIEINSNPAMDSSTSITARLCPQVLEDIVKVVIDRRNNKSAPTGSFEMVFKQNCPTVPPYLGMSLCLKGKKLFRPVSEGRMEARKSKKLSSDSESDETSAASGTPRNIVEERCSKDFMQPIKTLIDTIKGGYGPDDVKEPCDGDNAYGGDDTDTDSVYYGSGSSEDSDQEKHIALAGKEMELKLKHPKQRAALRTAKHADSDKTDDSEDERKKEEEKLRTKTERGKTDWIRRNIEYVRGSSHKKKTCAVRSAMPNLALSRLAETKEVKIEKATRNELVFRSEIIEMLNTEECQKFIKELAGTGTGLAKGKDSRHSSLISLVWEPETSKEEQSAQVREEHGGRNEGVEELLKTMAPVVDDGKPGIEMEIVLTDENNVDRVLTDSNRPRRIPAVKIPLKKVVRKKKKHTVKKRHVGPVPESGDARLEDDKASVSLEVPAVEPQQHDLGQQPEATNPMETERSEPHEVPMEVEGGERVKNMPRRHSMDLDLDLDNGMSLLSISDFSEAETPRPAQQPNSYFIINTEDSFSDFDSKFERILKELASKDDEASLCDALTLKKKKLLHKGYHAMKWKNGKTSMEYFREWKYKVDETRKNCEDMLAKLKDFKAANSKIRFQDVLKTKLDREPELVKKFKQRNERKWIEINKHIFEKRRRRDSRSPKGKEAASPTNEQSKADQNSFNSQLRQRIEEIQLSVAGKRGRHSQDTPKKRKADDSELRSTKLVELVEKRDQPLVITTESGAVRNVSHSLPKIKQRNQPLLPSGSSGHGRPLEASENPKTRKKHSSRFTK